MQKQGTFPFKMTVEYYPVRRCSATSVWQMQHFTGRQVAETLKQGWCVRRTLQTSYTLKKYFICYSFVWLCKVLIARVNSQLRHSQTGIEPPPPALGAQFQPLDHKGSPRYSTFERKKLKKFSLFQIYIKRVIYNKTGLIFFNLPRYLMPQHSPLRLSLREI